MKNILPSNIKKIIMGLSMIEITDFHRSGDFVYNIENQYILKISSRIADLHDEMVKNDYLIQYLPVPKSIAFEVSNGYAYYLKTYLPGVPLCDKEVLKNPERVVNLLVEAITLLHSVDVHDCPFVSKESVGDTFVHGDCCLPNFLVYENKISGIIDLDAAGVGDSYLDYVWALWSLEYNLQNNHFNELLIKKLNIDEKLLEIKTQLYIKKDDF